MRELAVGQMPELLGVSDRIMVMNDGRITEILTRAEATQENVLTAAIKGTTEEGSCEE